MLQRRIVSRIYEYMVGRLSRLFDCRMREILISYGDAHFLETRRVGADGDMTERADPISYDDARWHPLLEPLCKQLGLEVDRTLTFYREQLAQLDESHQARTFSDYLGRQEYQSYHRRNRRQHDNTADPVLLLQVMRVACDPVAFPPLVAGEPAGFQAVLAAADIEPSPAWPDALADRYRLGTARVIGLMRAMNLDAFDAMRIAPAR